MFDKKMEVACVKSYRHFKTAAIYVQHQLYFANIIRSINDFSLFYQVINGALRKSFLCKFLYGIPDIFSNDLLRYEM